jgi:hypothetical protein
MMAEDRPLGADRRRSHQILALVQQKVMREHLWMPVLNINMDQVANKRSARRGRT